jgi:hypothetical protein
LVAVAVDGVDEEDDDDDDDSEDDDSLFAGESDFADSPLDSPFDSLPEPDAGGADDALA